MGMIHLTLRLWLLLGRKTGETVGEMSFNYISNVLLFKKITYSIKSKASTSVLGCQVLIILLYHFLYIFVCFKLYWTNSSKEITLETIRSSPSTSAEISGHSAFVLTLHSPSSFYPYIKVKYAFGSDSPPWAWLCPQP